MAEFRFGNIICENIDGHAGPAMYVGKCIHPFAGVPGTVLTTLYSADILWLGDNPPRHSCVDIRPWELCTHLVDEEGNLPNASYDGVDLASGSSVTRVFVGGVDVTDKVKIKDAVIYFSGPISWEDSQTITIEYNET